MPHVLLPLGLGSRTDFSRAEIIWTSFRIRIPAFRLCLGYKVMLSKDVLTKYSCAEHIHWPVSSCIWMLPSIWIKQVDENTVPTVQVVMPQIGKKRRRITVELLPKLVVILCVPDHLGLQGGVGRIETHDRDYLGRGDAPPHNILLFGIMTGYRGYPTHYHEVAKHAGSRSKLDPQEI